MEKRQFDFGHNWKVFSEHALTAARVKQAKEHFNELLYGIDLHYRSFLDIGFGQGLTLLAAASMGANAVGCDINPVCADVLRQNQKDYFPELSEWIIPIVVGSILNDDVVESLRNKSPNQMSRAYDIVHSWGVLHHTGQMQRAIRNAASLVGPGGHLVIAIYASHWSSGAWTAIKRLYNNSCAGIQRLMIAVLWPVIYIAKWLVTRRNPLWQSRGMDFYYDVVDWVGGYPYEYATIEEVKNLLNPLGFRLERIIPTTVPTGCNEFVFKSERRRSM
jgi:2-polyprenyl-6-hydroxyphenyl methylase/3-demethylubiquinone-9 3-methyltransferase